MTGSFWVAIVVPIVAFLALAAWLGMVYWADAHPGWKARPAAPGPGLTGAGSPPAAAGAGDRRGGELTPPDRKAA